MNKEKKMPLPKLDDFFSTQSERDLENQEHVQEIDISKIDSFSNHPFKVIENDELLDMAHSIKENGILVPAIIRQKENGKYEMISGHRRKRASELAGKETMPCIVRNLSDDAATIIMVDSNMQREKILPSEKAFAYKMKLDAIKHQGKKVNDASLQVATKSAKLIGQEFGESQDNVYRYIRLTYLVPELLQLVDNDILGEIPKMALSPAVAISYLSKEEQYSLLDSIEYFERTPSLSQAQELKRLSQANQLSTDDISDIMDEEKPNQVEKIKIRMDKVRGILPTNLYTDEQKEDFIVKAVQFYCQRMRNQDKGAR